MNQKLLIIFTVGLFLTSLHGAQYSGNYQLVKNGHNITLLTKKLEESIDALNQTKEKLQSFKGLGELWFLLDANQRDMIDRLEKEEDDYAKKCEVLRLQIEDMKKAITE